MLNLIGGGTRPDPDDSKRVKEWVRELMCLPDDTVVTVMELKCQEEDCPDVETVIGVLGGPGQTRKHKLMKSISEVTKFDIMSIAASGTYG